MKKKLLGIFLAASFLIPGATAFAFEHGDYDSWYMQDTNTKIRGSLYLLNDGDPDVGQARTENVSKNGVKVKVKIYATADGQKIRGSEKVDTGTRNAYATGTARRPDCWGSGHTTTPSNDPFKWLYLQVSDLY